MPYTLIQWLQGLYIVPSHSTIDIALQLQAFEQFGALYMNNLADKHPTRPAFEPSRPTSAGAPSHSRYEWATRAGLILTTR